MTKQPTFVFLHEITSLSFAYLGQGSARGPHDAGGFGKIAGEPAHRPYFTGRAAGPSAAMDVTRPGPTQ
jgi:hypothetical protein